MLHFLADEEPNMPSGRAYSDREEAKERYKCCFVRQFAITIAVEMSRFYPSASKFHGQGLTHDMQKTNKYRDNMSADRIPLTANFCDSFHVFRMSAASCPSKNPYSHSYFFMLLKNSQRV